MSIGTHFTLSAVLFSQARGFDRKAFYGGNRFRLEETSGDGKIVWRPTVYIFNCEFYRLTVNLRALVRPIRLKIYER